MNIAVLLTCFNRREVTLASLRRLFENAREAADTVDVYLTDDGSSDGTAQAVAEQFPQVTILHGDGSLFWGGGTNLAWRAAAEESEKSYDYFVWLNDDSQLYDNVFSRYRELLADAADGANILVGSFQDPDTGEHTYGGVAIGPRPLQQTILQPTEAPQDCQVFNGNFVWVSRLAFKSIGYIDPAFPHIMGDTDYGLRATRAGIRIQILPGICGVCPRNPIRYEPSRIKRLRSVNDPKKRPLSAWVKFCFRHGGVLAPIIFARPYLKAILGTRQEHG